MKKYKVIAIILIVTGMVTTGTKVRSWNDASRMANIQAIVEHGSFRIDRTVFLNTGDKVYIQGNYYSDKPPMPALLGAAVYAPLYKMGLNLAYGHNLAYYLITILTVKVFWGLSLVAFFCSLRFTGLQEKYRLALTLALGLASLHFTWSSVFNNHSLAASALIIGFYYLLNTVHGEGGKRDILLAGIFWSLSAAMDMPTSAFYAVGFLYLWFSPYRRDTTYYLLPLLVTMVPTLWFNYYISGSIMPVQINKSFFDYPGSPWIGAQNLSGIEPNQGWFLIEYAFLLLFGPKGFVLHNPLLLIAIPGLVHILREKGKFWKESLMMIASMMIIVSYYMIYTNNFSGYSFSIRWFVPLLPCLYFFIFPYFENFNPARQQLFGVLVVISFMIAMIGLSNPWANSEISHFPVVSNLKQLYWWLANYF